MNKLWISTGLIAAVVLAVAGCARTPVQEDQFTKEMRQKFAEMNDPRSAVDKARRYALEKLADITDKEIKLLNSAPPVIDHNYDETEYSFFWKNEKSESGIQVLATPPPCEPIAVFRGNRAYYP